jgi:hypothetical protein
MVGCSNIISPPGPSLRLTAQRAGVENKLIPCGGLLDWTEEYSSVSGKESSGSEIRIAGDGVYLYLYLCFGRRKFGVWRFGDVLGLRWGKG